MIGWACSELIPGCVHVVSCQDRTEFSFLTGGSISEFDSREMAVGPFRNGILCKERELDAWLLIDNQLERTDRTFFQTVVIPCPGPETATFVRTSASRGQGLTSS